MAADALTGRGRVVRELTKRLREEGYRSDVLRHAVPEWWTADVEDEDEGATEHLKLILARRLGLDVGEFLQHDRIVPDAPVGMRFKQSKALAEQAPPDAAQAYCASIARLVAATIPRSKAVSQNAAEVRAEILAYGDAAWVSLGGLLRYCWSRNIAVLHVAAVPGARGMDALVYRVNGCDVIVVTRNEQRLAAWDAFLIAHELGHIALGHVRENESLADVVDEGEGANGEGDANRFALGVLGSLDSPPFWRGFEGTPRQLADLAWSQSTSLQVDPEHLALRFGRETNDFAFMHRAIKTRCSQPSYPMRTVNAAAEEHLDLSSLPPDVAEMLSGVLREPFG